MCNFLVPCDETSPMQFFVCILSSHNAGSLLSSEDFAFFALLIYSIALSNTVGIALYRSSLAKRWRCCCYECANMLVCDIQRPAAMSAYLWAIARRSVRCPRDSKFLKIPTASSAALFVVLWFVLLCSVALVFQCVLCLFSQFPNENDQSGPIVLGGVGRVAGAGPDSVRAAADHGEQTPTSTRMRSLVLWCLFRTRMLPSSLGCVVVSLS